MTTVPRLEDSPVVPEVALIAVPGQAAVDAVRVAAGMGTKGAIVMSSGFGETHTAEGLRMQEELLGHARAAGMRVVGPNSQGLASLLVDQLSPAETMSISAEAQNLAHGFPSGAELTAVSAPLRLYAIFDAVGIGVVGATQWMIALEAMAVFVGVYVAARILRPQASQLVLSTAAAVAVAKP